ncbi:Ig-like domain-containing protein [Candidatus Uabimicrobium amorphum]|uniref:DUF1573 domain-containing protein n=1 Tax=Uabimicrobium amorphum TaxID=2596890 RepID=A0A5S9F4U6_UABAM|nr:DUF1573 domain-containing protein [Candidatus Uabimicrobium amorphum]BBM84969.1 hypothetical protein UABAM_03330 [Candidatus Uabimicrobium amorphum]
MRHLLLILAVIAMAMGEIEISPPFWDLKTIAHDSLHVKKFVLRNKSEKKVVLAEKPTGCSCIRYQIKQKTLQVNETTEISVTVEPRGQIGDFNWRVPVEINQNQEITISVSAKIRKKFFVYPTQINFGVVKKGKSSSASLVVMSPHQTDFIVDSIECSQKFLTVVHEKKTITDFYPGTQTGYEVTVSLKDDIPFGRHSEYLTIHTNIAENKTFKVPVFFYVTGDLTTVPDYVTFAGITSPKTFTKRVTLYHNNFEKFQILSTKTSSSFIKVRTEKVIDEKYYYLYIDVDTKNAPKGEFRDIVKVRTDCVTQEYIPVYVHGFVK